MNDYLLADLFDQLNTLVRLTAAKYAGEEKFRSPPPRDRPGDSGRAGKRAAAEAAERAEAIRRARAIERQVLPRR